MVWADWVVRAFALFGVVVFSWQVGKYGIRYVMTEIAGWFSVAKNDFELIVQDVKNIEARLKRVEQHPALSVPPLVPSVPPPNTPAA